jgi:aminoglycoside 6'-N-acetyltransferase I
MAALRHTGPLQIREPRGPEDCEWLALRLALWPEGSREEHVAGMLESLARGHYVRLAVAADGTSAGFIEASRRHDYVNGTATSPVGFLEGVYVVPEHRRQGVARELVAAAAHWAARSGCSEFASDTLLDNSASHAMHRALGFEETERVVYFRRPLSQA